MTQVGLGVAVGVTVPVIVGDIVEVTVADGVAVNVGVFVAVGGNGTHSPLPPSHTAPNTGLPNTHWPFIGGPHEGMLDWQQSLTPGVLVGVAVLVGVGDSVGVAVALGVAVAVAVFVGLGVAVLVAVFVGVLVRVGVAVFVGVTVGESVGVTVAVFVGVSVGVGVFVAVSVGVGVNATHIPVAPSQKALTTVVHDGLQVPPLAVTQLFGAHWQQSARTRPAPKDSPRATRRSVTARWQEARGMVNVRNSFAGSTVMAGFVPRPWIRSLT